MTRAERDDAFNRILEMLIAGNARPEDGPISTAGSMPFWDTGRHEPSRRARRTTGPADFFDSSGNEPDSPAKSATNEAPEAAAQPVAAPLPPNRIEDIRAELGIKPGHDLADLGKLRKAFAAANHPDRNPGARRGWAEERMKLANSIIDAEIARRRAAPGRGLRT